jgi:hypothetical protein
LPLTDIANLMDQMQGLFTAGPIEPTQADQGRQEESLLNPPMPQLVRAPRSFAQVYGVDGGAMLENMAADADSGGDAAMANLLRTLDAGLSEGAFDLPQAAVPAPRFGRFVYPVV